MTRRNRTKLLPQRSDVHRASVAVAAERFRVANAARPVLLLGAGASVNSGVPLAADAVKLIARAACARDVFQTNDCSRVKVGDYMRYLREQPWFIADPQRLAENFPAAAEHLLNPRDVRREFFMRELRATLSPSAGYVALARMAQRGLWRTALTTNFDSCLADALAQLGPSLHRYVEINRVPGDAVQLKVFGREPQIVYLHGAVEAYSDRVTAAEVDSLSEVLIGQLLPILRDSAVFVVGYRGSEHSIMNGLFGALRERTMDFKSGLYWATRTIDTLNDNVRQLADQCGRNFIDLPIDGFDEFFEDLDEVLAKEDIAAASRNGYLSSEPPKLRAPDERVLDDLTLADLDQDFMLAKLIEYCDEVRRPRVDRDTMVGLLIEQGLAARIDGAVVPTVGGYLLFGLDVQRRFPQAAVELTIAGKKRQWFRGNLLAQFRELTDRLNELEINRELRIKTDRGVQRKRAYHPRAITELVVNMLVHRDYEDTRSALIDVTPGSGIRFSNPGGFLAEVASQISIEGTGTFSPRRSVTAQRNPALADVFFGLRCMDKRGSGLCDSIDYMREHGGDARYLVEAGNTGFVGELLQARQGAPQESETAVPLHPFGVYVTNHLRFVALPPAVTIAPLTARGRIKMNSGEDLFGANNAGNAIFVQQQERVLSFLRPALLLIGAGDERVVEREYFQSTPGGTAGLSWLLREHFLRYLARFEKDGLAIEGGGHRAYFIKRGEETPRIVYDTPRRKGVSREMVKRRESKTHVWHENEGIVLDVVRFAGQWALQVKPFYMFTDSDGVRPLPPHVRTRLATSRMKFDRNPNVESDLTFWARYLGSGSPTIQVGVPGEYDLILSCEFVEIEVPEAPKDGS